MNLKSATQETPQFYGPEAVWQFVQDKQAQKNGGARRHRAPWWLGGACTNYDSVAVTEREVSRVGSTSSHQLSCKFHFMLNQDFGTMDNAFKYIMGFVLIKLSAFY